MSAALNSSLEIPWWKEPSKEQWNAWIAAWLGWTLEGRRPAKRSPARTTEARSDMRSRGKSRRMA